MKRLLLLLPLLALAGCGGGSSTTTVTVTRTVPRTVTVATTATSTAAAEACTGDDLSGRFAAVPGSAGAGNIVYRLRLVNTSSHACTVIGIPDMLLLDEQGAALPTLAGPSGAGGPAVAIELAPGDAAVADARFSPDVPGQGEPSTSGSCEPRAFTLVVRLLEGSVPAPVVPPTPVCEKGQLAFTTLAKH
jgi:uncharacterized protein DUF4232